MSTNPSMHIFASILFIVFGTIACQATPVPTPLTQPDPDMGEPFRDAAETLDCSHNQHEIETPARNANLLMPFLYWKNTFKKK